MTSKSSEAKKQKVTEENRMFNVSWELDFVFTLSNDKPVCLICQNSISVLKKPIYRGTIRPCMMILTNVIQLA